MIRVTVEVIPAGRPAEVELLGVATIANDGTGTDVIGNYTVVLSRRGNGVLVWRDGHVDGFPRKRLGAWDLLYRALKATVGD